MLAYPVRWVAAVVLLLGGPAPAMADAAPLEFAVKAAFVYKFAPYVQWPSSALPSGNAPFTLCVQGNDKVGELIGEAAAGEQVGGRPIRIVRVEQVTGHSGCQMLYTAGPDTGEVLRALQGAPVLTVTDADRHPNTPAIIGFTVREGRVRFMVDQAAAEQAGLTISSKLLALAYAVTGKREGQP